MRTFSKNFIIIGGLISFWIIWLVGVLLHGDGFNVVQKLGLKSGYEDAGQFGDAFGPLSSLMATFAAIGAWLAFQQSKSQAFESTFYSLLAHHNSIVATTDITSFRTEENDEGKTVRIPGEKFDGRDAYKRLLGRLRSTISSMNGTDDLDRSRRGYKRFHEKYEDDLAHYFRTLYHLVKFVRDSKSTNKELYIRIIRAQLSNSEQILLMYNCTVEKGKTKFKKLVEDYSLLHNMNIDEEVKHWENDILKKLLDPNAFRDSDVDPWPTEEELRNLTSA